MHCASLNQVISIKRVILIIILQLTAKILVIFIKGWRRKIQPVVIQLTNQQDQVRL